LGVTPEDLSLRLEEFNDLLLEQTLISSVIEMRKREEEQEAQSQNVSQHSEDRGEPSSSTPLSEASPRGLCSHSLSEPIFHEEDSSPDAEGRFRVRKKEDTCL